MFSTESQLEATEDVVGSSRTYHWFLMQQAVASICGGQCCLTPTALHPTLLLTWSVAFSRTAWEKGSRRLIPREAFNHEAEELVESSSLLFFRWEILSSFHIFPRGKSWGYSHPLYFPGLFSLTHASSAHPLNQFLPSKSPRLCS